MLAFQSLLSFEHGANTERISLLSERQFLLILCHFASQKPPARAISLLDHLTFSYLSFNIGSSSLIVSADALPGMDSWTCWLCWLFQRPPNNRANLPFLSRELDEKTKIKPLMPFGSTSVQCIWYNIIFLWRRSTNSKYPEWLPSLWITEKKNRRAYVTAVFRESNQSNFITHEPVLSLLHSQTESGGCSNLLKDIFVVEEETSRALLL